MQNPSRTKWRLLEIQYEDERSSAVNNVSGSLLKKDSLIPTAVVGVGLCATGTHPLAAVAGAALFALVNVACKPFACSKALKAGKRQLKSPGFEKYGLPDEEGNEYICAMSETIASYQEARILAGTGAILIGVLGAKLADAGLQHQETPIAQQVEIVEPPLASKTDYWFQREGGHAGRQVLR